MSAFPAPHLSGKDDIQHGPGWPALHPALPTCLLCLVAPSPHPWAQDCGGRGAFVIGGIWTVWKSFSCHNWDAGTGIPEGS